MLLKDRFRKMLMNKTTSECHRSVSSKVKQLSALEVLLQKNASEVNASECHRSVKFG